MALAIDGNPIAFIGCGEVDLSQRQYRCWFGLSKIKSVDLGAASGFSARTIDRPCVWQASVFCGFPARGSEPKSLDVLSP
jgi:hypothetical protein